MYLFHFFSEKQKKQRHASGKEETKQSEAFDKKKEKDIYRRQKAPIALIYTPVKDTCPKFSQ